MTGMLWITTTGCRIKPCPLCLTWQQMLAAWMNSAASCQILPHRLTILALRYQISANDLQHWKEVLQNDELLQKDGNQREKEMDGCAEPVERRGTGGTEGGRLHA